MGESIKGWSWEDVKLQLPIGSEVVGTVWSVKPYGVWVDLGVGFDGLILVPELAGEGPKQPEDYPQVGTRVSAKVLWHADHKQQISLTQRTKPGN